jgi:[acyl-carrier-protein] S-malonyltransferase
MGYAVLFPGQGSQFVGMGADVFEARPDLLGETADEVLGWSLQGLCSQGPDDELTRTDRAQPALYAISFALWEAFKEEAAGQPVAAAGHSLGEYTALAAAGSIDFLTGLRLVAERGRAMAQAAAQEPSGMAAVIGADASEVESVAARRRDDGGRLWVANLNAPGQVVVAGGSDDLDWLDQNASDLGLRRVVRLNVAGAFHSPFMESAAVQVRAALEATKFDEPGIPVWANATAEPYGIDVRGGLELQLTSPVRFSDSLQGMASAGAEVMIHIGPGDVTAGLAKRSVAGITTATAPSLAEIAEAAAIAADSV